MDEKTTTDATAQDDQAPIMLDKEDLAQPEPEQQAEAAAETKSEPAANEATENEVTEPSEPAKKESADNSTDEFDFKAWLDKKGIDPSTSEGQAQIAKSWREMEKKMHSTTTQASELEKQLTEQPLNVDTDNELVREALTRASRVETTLAVEKWKQAKGITPEQDEALGNYVQQNPDKGYLYKNGMLSLDDIYNMSGVANQTAEQLKKQGGQEALQTLANKQRSTAPRGSASQRTEPTRDDPFLAGFDNN